MNWKKAWLCLPKTSSRIGAMRKSHSVWIFAVLGFAGILLSDSAADDSKDAALSTAQSWLELVDSGKYADS